MARKLELLNYEATMVRCSNSAIKLLIWWGNNIGGGTMLISENELKESADLAIAYWKKQIVLCPYINDNDKEWCKEFVETMGKKELGKVTAGFEKSTTNRLLRFCDWNYLKCAFTNSYQLPKVAICPVSLYRLINCCK